MKTHIMKFIVPMLFCMLLQATLLRAQKKNLTPEDIKKWEITSQTEISNDGAWFAYTISLVDGDGWLIVKQIATMDEDTFQVSSNPMFSHDSKWLAFNIDLPQKERDQIRKSKRQVRSKVGILKLADSSVDTIEAINRFDFSDDGKFIALRKYKPEGQINGGTGLVCRNLESGIDHLIGDVSSYAFSEKGSVLAVIKETDNSFGNGVYLYNLENNSYRVLDSDRAEYLGLVWHEDDDALAFLKAVEDEDYEENTHEVFSVRDIDEKKFKMSHYDPADDESFPGGYRIVGDERQLTWSKDASALFFGLQEWDKKDQDEEEKQEDEEEHEDEDGNGDDEEKEENGDEEQDDEDDLPPPEVDIWHWKDVNIQPRQKKTSEIDKKYSYLTAWHIDRNTVVRLNDDSLKVVTMSNDQKYAIGYDALPYQPAFKDSWKDVYIVDTQSGGRERILEKYSRRVESSPDGKYLIYFKNKNWWTYDIERKHHSNLTQNINSRFDNFTIDRPVAEPQPWGKGRWFEDDKAVLLYGQYDIWKVDPDGSKAEQLTLGAPEKIRFRQYWMDTEKKFYESGETIFLAATGDSTKDSGYYRLKDGKNLQKLIYEPRRVTRLRKAEDTEVFYFTKQKADESPDMFLSNVSLEQPVQLTHTNLQQDEFHWAGTELVNFENDHGEPLQGILLYPANYESGKKYPMIVFIYEKRSQNLHNYSVPSNRYAYNQRVFSDLGFFVYEPDIVYRVGDPGLSAVESVVPAVREVLKRGDIDENRIGLMGHSWGAYQTAFLVTKTDFFAAAVAGAPLINMISMYSSIYWNTGGTNQVIFETSQGRLPEPYWNDWNAFVRNSPVFGVNNIQTPLLIAFGDEDGAVDWNQGIEMFNAMRRQEKEVVMLVYEGENHSLSKKENRHHYAQSVREWFLHFLKDEPAPDWIKKGVPYLERLKKDEK